MTEEIFSVKSNLEQTELILGCSNNVFCRFHLEDYQKDRNILAGPDLDTSDFDCSDDLKFLLGRLNKKKNVVKHFKLGEIEGDQEDLDNPRIEYSGPGQDKDFAKFIETEGTQVNVRDFDKASEKRGLIVKKNKARFLKLLDGENRFLVSDLNFRILLVEDGQISQLFLLGNKFQGLHQPQLRTLIWGVNRSSFVVLTSEGAIVSCELIVNETDQTTQCKRKVICSLEKEVNVGAISSNGKFLVLAGKFQTPSQVIDLEQLEISTGDLKDRIKDLAQKHHGLDIDLNTSKTPFQMGSKIDSKNADKLLKKLKYANQQLQYWRKKHDDLHNDMEKRAAQDNRDPLKIEVKELRKQLADTIDLVKMNSLVNRNYSILTKKYLNMTRGLFREELINQTQKRNYLYNKSCHLDSKIAKILKKSTIEKSEEEVKSGRFEISSGSGFKDIRDFRKRFGLNYKDTQSEEDEQISGNEELSQSENGDGEEQQDKEEPQNAIDEDEEDELETG